MENLRTPKKRKTNNYKIDGDTPSKINATQNAMKYFEFFETKTVNGKEKHYFRCTVCTKKLNGNNQGNLVSHLQGQGHEEIYKKISKPKQSIEQIRRHFLLDCVEMVTINGRSFSHLYDSALLSMLKPTLDELASAGRKVNLTDPHLTEVKEYLLDISQKVRQMIRCEVKDRPLSLMIDIVSKRGRSLLGFSLQYIINGKLKTRSIGMSLLKSSHTAVYLAKLILERLHDLNIALCQILTITTDNGANMLKMVRDMQQILECELQKATQISSNNSNDAQNTTNILIQSDVAINSIR